MSSELADVRVNATTLGDLLLIASDQNPDRAAIVLPDQRITYAELKQRVIFRARSLCKGNKIQISQTKAPV